MLNGSTQIVHPLPQLVPVLLVALEHLGLQKLKMRLQFRNVAGVIERRNTLVQFFHWLNCMTKTYNIFHYRLFKLDVSLELLDITAASRTVLTLKFPKVGPEFVPLCK